MNTDALARHLAALLEDSDRLDTAIEKLKTACAANRHADIDALHAVLADRAGPAVGQGYSTVLPQLLAATGDSAAHLVAAFRAFHKLLQVWRDNQQACWAGLYRGLGYFGVVILVALSVFSLFANLVIPQFEVLFLEMAGNARMPVVTRAVFGGSGWILIVPALAIARYICHCSFSRCISDDACTGSSRWRRSAESCRSRAQSPSSIRTPWQSFTPAY